MIRYEKEEDEWTQQVFRIKIIWLILEAYSMIISCPLIWKNSELLQQAFNKIKSPLYNLMSYCTYLQESSKLRVYLINILDSIADLANEHFEVIEYWEELECLISRVFLREIMNLDKNSSKEELKASSFVLLEKKASEGWSSLGGSSSGWSSNASTSGTKATFSEAYFFETNSSFQEFFEFIIQKPKFFAKAFLCYDL